MENGTHQILIVEDDQALNNGIALALKTEEYAFTQVHSLREAERSFGENQPELIILDLNLADGNGLDFLQVVRKTTDIPVIILTANDLETDIVTGLSLGADDYITKPFSLMVLRARVEVQLRKLQGMAKEDGTAGYEEGPYRFSFDHMEFWSHGNRVELSKAEQKLLRLLVENKGQTMTRDLLVDRIWSDGAEYVDENALSVTIKRLRDKLEENPGKPQYIQTVYGIGYGWMVKKTG